MKRNVLSNSLKDRACTGCSICESVCPTNAIKIELNKDGFYEPNIDDEKCISCELCKKQCYKFDKNVDADTKTNYKCYSAINKSKEELKSATSGGVSIELMRECLKRGYKVVGVAYDYDEDIAITKIAEYESELEQFKGSKYFQSYTVNALTEIVKDKSEQKYAFFGTPCQIYALSKYADFRKCSERFILVDLFCHGCPTINLWRKYIDHSKQKFKIADFDKIEFRSKNHGWHEFGFKFENGKSIHNSKKTNDEFYELFFGMDTHNEACYNCKMRSSLEFTDIRLGDFWGHQYDLDVEGVSAVVACSNRGESLFKSIESKFKVKEHSFDETIHSQSYGKPHAQNNELRKLTLQLLSSDIALSSVVKKYRENYSVKKKVKLHGKNILKLLPKGIYLKLKLMVHKAGK